MKTTLEADFHQKLIMKFTLKDKSSGKSFAAHQTFVKLTNVDSKQEIIFVAEADSNNVNKFDLVSVVLLSIFVLVYFKFMYGKKSYLRHYLYIVESEVKINFLYLCQCVWKILNLQYLCYVQIW